MMSLITTRVVVLNTNTPTTLHQAVFQIICNCECLQNEQVPITIRYEESQPVQKLSSTEFVKADGENEAGIVREEQE